MPSPDTPRAADSAPTPYEMVCADNTDLRARLALANERAFDDAVSLRDLRAINAELLAALKRRHSEQSYPMPEYVSAAIAKATTATS